MNIIKRNGSEMTFDGNKIVAAITKANTTSRIMWSINAGR